MECCGGPPPNDPRTVAINIAKMEAQKQLSITNPKAYVIMEKGGDPTVLTWCYPGDERLITTHFHIITVLL